MDAVLYLRQAARFKSMELEGVEVIFRLEASSRSRLRIDRGNRTVARKRSPFELAATDSWPRTISGLLGIQFSVRGDPGDRRDVPRFYFGRNQINVPAASI